MKREFFQNPPKEFREAPFWSWNDVLVDEELRRQIAQMDEGGWGGFFMHARIGLVTPYLSKEWMERIKTSVAEAKRRGMGAWLYDEDRWPSGYAGGIVPRLGAKYRHKALCLFEDEPPAIEPGSLETISVYSARKKAGGITEVKEISPEKKEKEKEAGKTIFLISQFTASLGDERFNGTAYVDLMDPEVVRAFIQSTYEAYKKEVGQEFGRTVPGIFTDEPCYLIRRQGIPHQAVPWTPRILEEFKQRRGYPLKPHLLCLFYEIGEWQKVRYDFYRTATELFLEAFTKQIYEWCQDNNLKLTGHFLAEDSLARQTDRIGAAMPHYEYMQQPGMDHLGRNINNAITAKQVASVAEQMGRPRVLSELYGCSGHNFSLEERKWMADWHLILGVNFLNPHLSLYTMRGRRKRDFPPNIFFQQPYWKYHKWIADYLARLSYALSQGKRMVDILLIHPIESAWALYEPKDKVAVDELNTKFVGLLHNLLAIHRDFELGDESIIARHGSVSQGKFVVGEKGYALVIVPSALTLRDSTIRLLEEFASQGGKILFLGEKPTLIEAREDSRGRLASITKRAFSSSLRREEIAVFLNEQLPFDVRIEGENADKVWYHHRRIGNEDIYFFANTDLKEEARLEISLRSEGQIYRWDAATGEVEKYRAILGDGLLRFNLVLLGAGSALFTVS